MDDIQKLRMKCKAYYIVQLKHNASTESRETVDTLVDDYRTVIYIWPSNTVEEARSAFEDTHFDGNVIICVEKFREMDQEMQDYLGQQLKALAESYTDLAIIVKDVDSQNSPSTANRDLVGRVYSLD